MSIFANKHTFNFPVNRSSSRQSRRKLTLKQNRDIPDHKPSRVRARFGQIDPEAFSARFRPLAAAPGAPPSRTRPSIIRPALTSGPRSRKHASAAEKRVVAKAEPRSRVFDGAFRVLPSPIGVKVRSPFCASGMVAFLRLIFVSVAFPIFFERIANLVSGGLNVVFCK